MEKKCDILSKQLKIQFTKKTSNVTLESKSELELH